MDLVKAHQARAIVDRARRMSEQSLGVFEIFFDEDTCWPYELVDRQPIQVRERLSQSTTAMILHACSVATGLVTQSVLAPSVWSWKPLLATPDLVSRLSCAAGALFESCVDETKPICTSRTWGDNDPLTMMWLYELSVRKDRVFVDDEKTRGVLHKRLRSESKSRVLSLLKNPSTPVLEGADIGRSEAITHAFPILRTLQLLRLLRSDEQRLAKSADFEPLTDWLENELHTQLSLSEIVNSDFDPAQLVFALESLLLLEANRATDALVGRTLDVMTTSTHAATYWRPIRPLRVDSQGSILLPQSVEVANSLLRIGGLLEEESSSVDWTGAAVTALSPYLDWVEGRTIRGRTDEEQEFEGWQSDHTHRPGSVHLWATSQVLLFCLHYGALAQQYLARELRNSTGVQVEPRRDRIQWQEVERKEPLAGLPLSSSSRVYSIVRGRYVEPRLAGGSGEATSILLYGPPGTGKTSFAEDLAAVLGYELLTVTPSDFIQQGEAGVEARSQQVFEMLMEQRDTVVLFDEIDRLILSRDSAEYGNQSDMFQFMTPSMLTKLNRLRREGNVISIIATNYEDRVDGAIKRSGRIDDALLLLPPDRSQRATIVGDRLRKVVALPAGEIDALAQDVAEISPLFAYQELRYVVEKATSSLTGELDVNLRQAVDEFSPAISLGSYKNRFDLAEVGSRDSGLADDAELLGVGSDAGPWREFLYLAYLVADVGNDPSLQSPWIKVVVDYGLAHHRPVDTKVQEVLLAIGE